MTARKETDKMRRFRFRVSSMRLKFIGKPAGLSSVFLELEVGGRTIDVKSQATKVEKVEKKSADGESKNVEVATRKLQTNILAHSAQRYYTRLMSIRDEDEPTVQFNEQETSGEWYGTYGDLLKETLDVRLWHTTVPWSANLLLGQGEETLEDVAATKVAREIVISKYREKKSARAEALAILTYKFELEEVFSFRLTFSNWKIELDDADLLEPQHCMSCFTRGKDPLVLGFEMDNANPCIPSASLCLDGRDFACCNVTCCCFDFVMPWTRKRQVVWTERDRKTSVFTEEDATAGKDAAQSLLYTGTRSALEDEQIAISMWKGFHGPRFLARSCWLFESLWGISCCCLQGPLVGTARETLQGKLDYGYVILYDTPLDAKSSCCLAGLCDRICGSDGATATNIKGVIKAENEPRYRQLGNLGRPVGNNKWFKMDKSSLYLCVKIVRAKGLVSLGKYKESLNPSVTVDWGQIRRETVEQEDNAEPFWNEWVYFKVPTDSEPKPNLSMQDVKTWANSQVVINVWDNQGFSKDSLGFCEIDFQTIFYGRKPKMIDSNSGRGGRVSRYVYATKQKLSIPQMRDDAKGGVESVAADDGRHIEIWAYFDLGNNQRVGPPRNRQEMTDAKGKKRKRESGIDESKLRQANAFWCQVLDSVPHVAKRTFAFCGIDEYSRKTFYLPMFVSVMVPPAEVATAADLLYYVYSLETVLRKTGDAYEAAVKTQEELEDAAPGLRIWADPWYFLDKRRGDHRDHAILLCNFLLGFRKHKAYICVGRAKDTETQREKEHVWVMTLEDPVQSRDGTFYRTVRFWEATNGRTYVRMNKRIDRRSEGDDTKNDMDDGELIEQNLDLSAPIGDLDGDGDEGYSIQESKTVSRYAALRERKRFQQRLQKRVKAQIQEEDEEAWNKLQASKLNFRGQSAIPYTGIDIVFNNTELYANLQSPDPSRISFDFESPLAWRSFRGKPDPNDSKRLLDDGEKYFWKSREERTINPFYPDKTMVSRKVNEQVIKFHERELVRNIEEAIQAWREIKTFSTTFGTQFGFQESLSGSNDVAVEYIGQRLDIECRLGQRCPLLAAMEQAEEFKQKRFEMEEERTDSDDMDAEEKDVEIKSLKLHREQWRRDVLNGLPRDRLYSEILFNFKHADNARIADEIVQRIGEKGSLLKFPPEMKPKFFVGAKIHRLPGMVSPSRVLVCVTYENSRASNIKRV